jgi:hypothetical protein
MVVILVGVIVAALVLGTLGLVGVIGRQPATPSASPVEITDTDAVEAEDPPTPDSPPPGLTPSEPDIPAFCELMGPGSAVLDAIGGADPASTATITEDIKVAMSTVRDLRGVAPEDIAEQFETALTYLDSLQEFVETGEEPAQYADHQAAYGEAVRLITEKKESVCP